MKRHPALIPLSRDHHNGLVQALRLRRAAADGDASARLAVAREFVEFFRNEERVHLRDEEEELFPLLLRHVPSQPAPLREARVQHVQLEGFARKLDIAVAAGSVDRETLDAAGQLLDAHIRLEERQLFPLIEELVPDDELRRLGFADRDTTSLGPWQPRRPRPKAVYPPAPRRAASSPVTVDRRAWGPSVTDAPGGSTAHRAFPDGRCCDVDGRGRGRGVLRTEQMA